MLQAFNYQIAYSLPTLPAPQSVAPSSEPASATRWPETAHQTPIAGSQTEECANLHTPSMAEKNNTGIPPINGFAAMRDAAKRDFFTIRADTVQDGALGAVDTLAEYLVWDGMDRRLRAIASANHTNDPEAIVTVKQIANDIKIRVGHDLCERTIERAIKKLQDASLIHVTPRFKDGRRQASSFILLFSPSMSEKLNKSRRVKKSSAPDTSEVGTQTDFSATKNQVGRDDIPPQTSSARTSAGLSSIAGNLQHIQACMRQIAAEHFCVPNGYSGQPTVPDQSPGDQQNSVQICTLCSPDGMEVAENANPASNDPSPSSREQRDSPDTNHPTSMSPLFNKAVKENKKDFKNVFSISDFSKKERSKENQTVLQTDAETGYYLDTVHRSGWVSSPRKHLQDHFGSLSTYLFFNKYRTIEAMAEWFQQQENRINHGETSLSDVLAAAGITPERSQDYEQKITI